MTTDFGIIKIQSFPFLSAATEEYLRELNLKPYNFFYTDMKPNIHEYPTNESELPAYRVAVMQAALEGRPVEKLFCDSMWSRASTPVWNWDSNKYRIARPKARYFRKPGGLFGPTSDPSEQYCVRMIDGVCAFVDVSGGEDVDSTLTRAIVEGHVSTGHWIEFDGDMTPWKPKAPPVSPVSPVAAGHNPRKLTEEQVGKGYRLLTAEEVEANVKHSEKINQKVCTGPRDKPEGIEMWVNTSVHWHPGAWGDAQTITYRTKKPPGFYLSKPKAAEGHNPAGVTENQIPAGWRLFSTEEFAFLCTTVPYKGCSPRVSGTRYWTTPANRWSDVREWGMYPSSSGTLITDKPSGFYLPKSKILKPWSLATLKWPDCIRHKGGTTGRNILTSSLQGLWVFYGANQDGRHPLSWQALFDNFEASFDHGQTWVPCGTEEDAS